MCGIGLTVHSTILGMCHFGSPMTGAMMGRVLWRGRGWVEVGARLMSVAIIGVMERHQRRIYPKPELLKKIGKMY